MNFISELKGNAQPEAPCGGSCRRRRLREWRDKKFRARSEVSAIPRCTLTPSTTSWSPSLTEGGKVRGGSQKRCSAHKRFCSPYESVIARAPTRICKRRLDQDAIWLPRAAAKLKSISKKQNSDAPHGKGHAARVLTIFPRPRRGQSNRGH